MNINQDIVPIDLEEAVKMLTEALTDKEKIIVKDMTNAGLHLTLGQFIRNEWSLWDTDTILVQWFHKNYGIDHADDISAVITDCLVRDLNNKPRRADQLAADFKEHWETHNKKLKGGS